MTSDPAVAGQAYQQKPVEFVCGPGGRCWGASMVRWQAKASAFASLRGDGVSLRPLCHRTPKRDGLAMDPRLAGMGEIEANPTESR